MMWIVPEAGKMEFLGMLIPKEQNRPVMQVCCYGILSKIDEENLSPCHYPDMRILLLA